MQDYKQYYKDSKLILCKIRRMIDMSSSLSVSLWCPQCQFWTKKYNHVGTHECGTDVLSTGEGKQSNDIEYEGDALED